MKAASLCCCVSLVSLLAACSAGGDSMPESAEGRAVEQGVLGEPLVESSGSTALEDDNSTSASDVAGPAPLLVVQASPERLDALPTLAGSEIVADSGLQVAWTSATEPDEGTAFFVDTQWQMMQRCLGQLAPSPLVILVSGEIVPIMAADDIVRDINGAVTATANVGPVSILQVRASDVEAAARNRGFTLRSIMGRHLWLSAGLPERDYPFSCARGR